MDILKTDVCDVYILKPHIFGDSRGWFYESWSESKMKEAGLNYNFVQDNHAFSAQRGTIRGLHFQKGEFAQAKLVRCVKGAVLDVAVDLRKNSPSYLKWVAVELTETNYKQLLIPRGMAHGYLTLADNTEFLYKADNFYNPKFEGIIRYNDPDINIKWPHVSEPVISQKDKTAPFLKDIILDF